ncbi:hypothetical protein IZ6_30970 [Terrihabitans soli]|uniref:N-acetyltransferase domain-containing protein n=1 Tax=Terrihabitans soli TaxID=708113 RepID=A0A6S6QYK8_9HYPH|nr:GNAT family N-acetyltransferase [Terrihabitans soli]BCJ92362.1 hypothetical protein IZ6_30970 [Terrihabitans soli]
MNIDGRTIRLRLAELADAEFILSLRVNPALSTFVSPVSPDIEKQLSWLRSYKERERDKEEFYFIIESLGGTPYGAVRVYDFQGPSFCWGSWLISPDAPASTGIESALLVYEFAFYTLGFTASHFDVRQGNTRVIAFHERLGAVQVASNDLDCFFEFSKEAYEKIRPKYAKFLPA